MKFDDIELMSDDLAHKLWEKDDIFFNHRRQELLMIRKQLFTHVFSKEELNIEINKIKAVYNSNIGIVNISKNKIDKIYKAI